MTAEEILKLIDAGYTKDEISAMIAEPAPEQPEQADNPPDPEQPEPAPEPYVIPEFEAWKIPVFYKRRKEFKKSWRTR